MRLLTSIGIVVLVIVSCCYGQGSDTTVGATPENLAAVSQSVTNLAQKISLAIASPKSKTEIFSPVSIAGALSLLLLGSGGATREELMQVMGFQGSRLSFTDIHKSFGRLFQDLVSNEAQNVSIPWRDNDKCNNYDYDEEDDYTPPKPTNQRGKRDADAHFISVANGVFVDHSLHLNSRYVDLAKELYDGNIQKMSLYTSPAQSANTINRWVQEATRNKIQQIVSAEQVSNSPMVLASALYFKAKWETMFIEPDTRPRPFFLNGRGADPVNIDTMATSGCFPFYEDKQLGAKIVGLPYQEGKSTMYIILPNQSDRQKVQNLQQTVTLQHWDGIINQMVVKTGTILLPKMKIENTLGLRDVLNALGLQDVFNPVRSNLTAITRDDPILSSQNGQPATKPPRLGPSHRPTVTTPNNYNPAWEPPISTTPLSPGVSLVRQTERNHQRPTTIPTKYTPTRSQTTSTPSSYHVPPTTTWSFNPVNQYTTPASSYSHSQSLAHAQAGSTTVQQIPKIYILAVKPSECDMINYCKKGRDYCTCEADKRVAVEQKSCNTKPFIIQKNCPQEKIIFSMEEIQVCLVDWYFKTQACVQGCYELLGKCYCCTYSQTLQQSTGAEFYENHPNFMNTPQQQFGAQPYDNQQSAINPSQSPAIADGVGSRFGGNEQSRNPTPTPWYTTARPAVQTCRKLICNTYGCWYSDRCSYNGRRKRQAVNTQPSNLFVGDVLHKVTLDINEQGTEGGAVTAIVIDRISSSFNLRVDGPFLIYLRNEITKLPLFYGAVFDPRP